MAFPGAARPQSPARPEPTPWLPPVIAEEAIKQSTRQAQVKRVPMDPTAAGTPASGQEFLFTWTRSERHRSPGGAVREQPEADRACVAQLPFGDRCVPSGGVVYRHLRRSRRPVGQLERAGDAAPL